jgi:hypothetical protein
MGCICTVHGSIPRSAPVWLTDLGHANRTDFLWKVKVIYAIHTFYIFTATRLKKLFCYLKEDSGSFKLTFEDEARLNVI